jgi:hypothetical protein
MDLDAGDLIARLLDVLDRVAQALGLAGEIDHDLSVSENVAAIVLLLGFPWLQQVDPP